jgi:monoterpene epsilon-lactone hydrolase
MPRPPLLAELRQYRRLYRLVLQAATTTLIHRLRHGPQRPGWPHTFELLVQLLTLGLPDTPHFEAEIIRIPFAQLTRLPLPFRIERQPLVDGPVPGEWLCPPNHAAGMATAPVLLYFHGGGYIAGSPRTHRMLTAHLARIIPARVLSIDYRLAPEHPYPAAVVDAWAAYWWLLAQGIPPGQIVLAGDSAGGGLVVALLLALRDAHVPLPAGAVCLSPWLDLALEGESLHAPDSLDYLNTQVLAGCAHHYLQGVDPHTPLASPLYGDPTGLPPLLIQASRTELLADDSRRFAECARAAGVAVDLDLWDDLVHVWQAFYWISPAASEAIAQIGAFVRQTTGQEEANVGTH